MVILFSAIETNYCAFKFELGHADLGLQIRFIKK